VNRELVVIFRRFDKQFGFQYQDAISWLLIEEIFLSVFFVSICGQVFVRMEPS
jgi:hypothetical protein